MEQKPRQYEQERGAFKDLVDLLVEEGINGSQEHYSDRPDRLEGCKDGFELCRSLRMGDALDFEFTLVQMRDLDRQAYHRQSNGEIGIDKYWQQRFATIQVEYCYEVLRVAHNARYGELPDDERGELSARSIMRYNTLAAKLGLPL